MSLIQQIGHKRLINVFLSFLFSHCFVVLRTKPSILLSLYGCLQQHRTQC